MIMPGLKMTGSARSPDKVQIMNVASYKHRCQLAADRVNWRYTMNSETIMRINNDIELKTAGAGYDNCLCEVLNLMDKVKAETDDADSKRIAVDIYVTHAKNAKRTGCGSVAAIILSHGKDLIEEYGSKADRKWAAKICKRAMGKYYGGAIYMESVFRQMAEYFMPIVEHTERTVAMYRRGLKCADELSHGFRTVLDAAVFIASIPVPDKHPLVVSGSTNGGNDFIVHVLQEAMFFQYIQLKMLTAAGDYFHSSDLSGRKELTMWAYSSAVILASNLRARMDKQDYQTISMAFNYKNTGTGKVFLLQKSGLTAFDAAEIGTEYYESDRFKCNKTIINDHLEVLKRKWEFMVKDYISVDPAA